jgi:hypothetical protein
MPCFNGIRKRANCLVSSSGGAGSVEFRRRRFSISSSGTTIAFDEYGEAEEGITDVYSEITFWGILQKMKTVNDETSNVGGRPSSKREIIDAIIGTEVDVILNDIVEYPVNSNNWFQIDTKELTNGNIFYNIIGKTEPRSTL